MRGIGTVLGLVAFGPKLANKTLDPASDPASPLQPLAKSPASKNGADADSAAVEFLPGSLPGL